MTGAHLGGRGAGRQRGNTAEIAAKAAGVVAMVMGATTHGRSAVFFHQMRIGVFVFVCFPLLPNCAHGPAPPLLNRPYYLSKLPARDSAVFDQIIATWLGLFGWLFG